MKANEIINKICDNHNELAQCVYDMGIYRRVGTNDGYKVRLENIEKMRKLLDELEELNDKLEEM